MKKTYFVFHDYHTSNAGAPNRYNVRDPKTGRFVKRNTAPIANDEEQEPTQESAIPGYEENMTAFAKSMELFAKHMATFAELMGQC